MSVDPEKALEESLAESKVGADSAVEVGPAVEVAEPVESVEVGSEAEVVGLVEVEIGSMAEVVGFVEVVGPAVEVSESAEDAEFAQVDVVEVEIGDPPSISLSEDLVVVVVVVVAAGVNSLSAGFQVGLIAEVESADQPDVD